MKDMQMELAAISGGELLGKALLDAVEGKQYTIGRRTDNDFVISSEYVSRQHAVIAYHEAQWYIQNISSNGSFVNDMLAQAPTAINKDDKLSLVSGENEVLLRFRFIEHEKSSYNHHSITKNGRNELARDVELLIANENNSVSFAHIQMDKDAELSFGSSESCMFKIDSSHARAFNGCFVVSQGKLSLRQLNRLELMCINGRPFRGDERKLVPGDVITIGGDKGIMIAVSESGGKWFAHKLSRERPIRIGRSADNDIRLSHVCVSRKHATVSFDAASKHYIIENSGMNGTLLNGMTVNKSSPMREHSVISITNTSLYLCGDVLYQYIQDRGLSLRALSLSRDVSERNVTRRILDNVSINIEPGEFVAIIGGSGCGKSTLLNALTGYERASSGTVLVNGSSLYSNNDYFKSIIGFVPQQDIVYDHLRLDKMLDYTARLRMAKDTSEQEREARVREVLDMVELTELSGTMIKKLSGGQKKRASIAVELLADPGLFFLDEPTSGLDPGTERNLMNTLRRLSTNRHKTVVMVTHTTLNLHLCDKIIVMGKGGRLCYCGSPDKALSYFNVNDLVEIYDIVADERKAVSYAEKNHITDGMAPHAEPAHTMTKNERPGFFSQLRVLQKRYLNLICNDTARLILMLAEPLALVALLYISKSDKCFEAYLQTRNTLFTYVCCGIWIGIFNSVQEVCKERNILKREYMANLRLSAYVFSKFNVQALLSFVQGALLCSSFALLIGLPEEGMLLSNPLPEMLITSFLTIISSSTLALCLSSVCKDPDKAMTLSPFLLVFQLIFAGIIFPLDGAVDKISKLTVSRWSIAALGVSADLESVFVPLNGDSAEIYKHSAENLYTCWGVLLGFALLYCLISMLLLRNVSKDSR